MSDVLQKDVPQAYFLSSRRAASITRAGMTRFIPVFSELLRGHRYAMLGNAVSVPVVAAVAGKIKETTIL